MIVMYVNITLSDDSKTVVTIDNSTLESISSQITTAVSTSEPSYGIKAGSGSIVFKDVDKQFVTYSKEGYLNSSNQIDVYLKNTISGKEQLCGAWLSKEWNYDTDDETVTVTLRDSLESLQDIEMLETLAYTGIEDDGLSDISVDRTAYYLFKWLKYVTPDGNIFADVSEEDEEVLLLENIEIKNPYIASATLWTFYDNLCQLALLYIYKGLDGMIYIKKIY